MAYLFLGFSLITVFLLIFSRRVFYTYYDQINFTIKKRLDSMLKLTKIAPVIVLVIIFILTITYFKTKLNIRLFHAWFVLNFWIFTAIFFYIFIEIVKIRKLVIIIPIIGIIISMSSAIYLTSLYHYENIFQNNNLIVPNFFGLIMLITSYYINYMIFKKETKK